MGLVANNMSGMNAVGLKRKPTYEEVIDYVLRDPERIRSPIRFAKQIRDSLWRTQLDGEGMGHMEQQQVAQMKEVQNEQYLRACVMTNNINLQEHKR